MLNNICSILYFKDFQSLNFKIVGLMQQPFKLLLFSRSIIIFYETSSHKHIDETLNNMSAYMLWYITEY